MMGQAVVVPQCPVMRCRVEKRELLLGMEVLLAHFDRWQRQLATLGGSSIFSSVAMTQPSLTVNGLVPC